MTLYVDTSALVRAYLPDEVGHAALREQLLEGSGLRLLSSLASLEFVAAVRRAERAGRVARDVDLVARFDAHCSEPGVLRVVRVDLDRLHAPVRRLLAEHAALRTLDAVQLALALQLVEIGVHDLIFVSRDARQTDAARVEGLGVDASHD